MIKTVIMPKQGLQMTEGVITKWYYKEGDKVTANKPLFQIETDKLTIDIDAQYDGILLQIIRDEEETVAITEPIAYIGDETENDIVPIEPKPAKNKSIVTFATPRAKQTAKERSIDYTSIKGSGYNGIVIERDILIAISAGEIRTKLPEIKPTAAPVSKPDIKKESGTKTATAEKTSGNQAQAFHSIKADITAVLKLTDRLAQFAVNTGASAVAAYAAVKTISTYPHMNADSKEINLAIVMPCTDEYKISVISNAERLSLSQLSQRINDSETENRNAVFAFADFSRFDMDESYMPLRGSLNAVLTAGTVSEMPSVSNGTLFLRSMMRLTLTYDPDKMNDFYACEYLRQVKFLIENPNLLFI